MARLIRHYPASLDPGHAKAKSYRNALRTAVEAEHAASVRELLRSPLHGFMNVTYLSDDLSSLHAASSSGSVRCLDMMLSMVSTADRAVFDVNVKTSDSWNFTPLMLAIVGGNYNCALRLAQDARVDVNAASNHYLRTPLNAAQNLMSHPPDLVNLLLSRGAV